MEMTRMVNVSPPAECCRCGRVRPPVGAVNITIAAAGSVPSTMRPVCEDCMPKLEVRRG